MSAGVVAAFATIYLVWGSTYLAVRFAVETLPPFAMMGLRSLLAGVVLFGWGSWRGGGWPVRREWVRALGVGALLFLIGHGGLAWAQQRVPSGIASVVIATIPIWMTLIQAVTEGPGGVGPRAFVGIAGGSGGVLLLAGPGGFLGSGAIDLAGTVMLILAALSWSAGSAIARRDRSNRPVSTTTGMYLMSGGGLLFAASVLTGEPAMWSAGAVSLRSIVSLGYLILFGSVIAFAAYGWLLKRASLSTISTYAWVNPVVALFLGRAIAGEALNARVAAAASLVLASVVLTLSSRGSGDDRKNLAGQNTQGRRRNVRGVRSENGRRRAAAHSGQPCFDGAHCAG